MTITIPLNLLQISPLNARKTPPRAAEQAELAASIVAHGLLENLIVRLTDKDRYEVLAGGRRLMVLQSLVRDGELDVDHPVACLVHDGDPREVSLAENVVRLSMHALDQFEAFAALADQGLSAADISARFGCTDTMVRQRLRLGRIAPEIREAYRADDINLDTLTAFAVTEDHGQQLAVWEQVKDDYINAYQVRRLLTDEKIAAGSKFVRFIGRDAYDAAGGTSTRDLFCEAEGAIYLDDRALVMRLAQEKLSAAAEALQAKEGWKWVQAMPEVPWEVIHKCQNVYPERINPTPEQEAELTRLQERLESYDEEMANDTIPEDEDEIAGLEAEYEALESSLLAYAPEDISRSGCMVTVNHDGSLNVRRGLVLPEDQMTEADSPTDKPGTYSARLVEDLGHTRLEIAQKHLAQDVDCAYDVMLFTLARAVLKTGSVCDRPLDICFTTTLPHNWSERFETTGAELPPEIDMGWLKLAPAAGFAALSALPTEDKQCLFAYCTALTLRGRLGRTGDDDLHEVIGCRLGIDMAAHWRPTAKNFFKRVTKPRALEIAADVLGEQWTKNHAGEKKAVLADTLEANFAGNRTPGVTAEQAATAVRWLPDGMAYPVNHDDRPVAEVAATETELPEAFDLPAAV